MTRSRTITLIAVGASGLIALFVYWQQQRLNAARNERDELRQRVAALTSLREEHSPLAAAAAQGNSRLNEKELLELMRLRGEVRLLRQQVQQQASQAATNAAQNSTSAFSQDARTPLTAEISVRVSSGQTLVTGGWRTELGKRAFVFVTPVIDKKSDQPGRVVFRAEILEMRDDVLQQSGLADFTTEARDSSFAGLYSADQARTFRQAMQSLEGVRSDSQVLIAHEGGPARCRLGFPLSSNTRASNSEAVIELVPQIAPGGEGMDLTVRAELPRP